MNRSLLELRRLAYRAPRDPASRYVLQDVLLETVPVVFERLIEQAHAEDERSGIEQLVWFRPERLRLMHASKEQLLLWGWPPKRRRWSFVNWFYKSANRSGSTAQTNDIERAHALHRALEQRREVAQTPWHVIVYRTRGKL